MARQPRGQRRQGLGGNLHAVGPRPRHAQAAAHRFANRLGCLASHNKRKDLAQPPALTLLRGQGLSQLLASHDAARKQRFP